MISGYTREAVLMFTGLVEEVGSVLAGWMRRRVEGAALFVAGADKVLEGTRLGDSIAVSGACLTVVELGDDASPWTAWPRP